MHHLEGLKLRSPKPLNVHPPRPPFSAQKVLKALVIAIRIRVGRIMSFIKVP